MKDFTSINENELDGALNALFLEAYSHKMDESVAHFCMGQDYNVAIDSKKETELLARLNGKSGGGKNMIIFILALLLIASASLFLFNSKKEDKKIVSSSQQITKTITESDRVSKQTVFTSPSQTDREKIELKTPAITSPSFVPDNQQAILVTDSAPLSLQTTSSANNDPRNEKILPYFNKEGLAYFAKIKERVLQKLIKIDDFLYAKTEPGATRYKNSEVLVSPFVMSNFAVTNLQYKTFLADLATQGRIDDLKKCLPKEEIWKEYNCTTLAKSYFENESYNDFPVVNVDKEACAMFCEWLQAEMNQKFAESASISKLKGAVKKNQVIVRLPYDYEWIYSADAAYTLIPDCGSSYNTIYDSSEGLVDKDFFKHTSQVNKRDLNKETRMDKLSDVNRFGMTETEMISIFKEAITYKDSNPKSFNSSDPSTYPNNIEACCLAGHVCELIKNKEGEMVVRGCCWKSKEEYLKMMEVYNKEGASPFIGFRVMILNPAKSRDKNPFW